jgi:hypothetical protein
MNATRTVALMVALCAGGVAPAAELRRGPYLQVMRPDGVTIRWRTDATVRHTSFVRYGTSPDRLDKCVAASEPTTHFANCRDWQATVDGLEPDTVYYYALEADRAILCGADERHRFRTAPRAGAERRLRFWLLGDSGSNRPRADDLKAVLAATDVPDPVKVRNGFRKFNSGKPLDGIVLLGDNAYPFGTDEQYQAAFFNVYKDELVSVPLWPCTGNHDMDTAYKYLFTTNTDGRAGGVPSRNQLYYSADIGNLHLVVMDPWKEWMEETLDESHVGWKRQLAWLEKDLASTRRQWLWVVQHFPQYCDGNYNSDGNEPLVRLRERLVPLFDTFGVDLALSGHDHSYQRSHLLRGLTGKSDTLDRAKHFAFDGDGRTSPVTKVPGPNSGTLYVVAGCAGGTRPAGRFAHPAMVPFEANKGKRGLAVPSSLVIEIEGRTLRGWQVDTRGEVLDAFTLVHTAARPAPAAPAPRAK